MRFIALGIIATTIATLGLARIEEDSPHWDCTSMGNRICGGQP